MLGNFIRWIVTRVVIPTLIILTIICLCLFYFQGHLVFFPKAVSGYDTPDMNPAGMRNPGEHKVDYEDVYLTTRDGVAIHLWLMKQSNASETPTILFFQGNAGNMGFRLTNLVQMYRSLNVNMAAMSYRGYGFSSGAPTEQGVLIDASTALEYLWKRKDIGAKKIVLFGRSLGGAVAINTAVNHPDQVKGVIVENTFWDINEMALQLLSPFKLFPALLKLLLQVRFESGKLIDKMTVPILFLSGMDDTLVPPIQMNRLFETCGSAFKWFVRIHQGTHNDSWQIHPFAYYDTLREFMKAITADDHTSSIKTLDIGEAIKEEDAIKDVRELSDVTARAPRFYESALRQLRRFEVPVTKG